MWSDCSASCGTGRRTRIRGCNSPAPAHGGDLCNGPDTEIAECFKRDCPSMNLYSSTLLTLQRVIQWVLLSIKYKTILHTLFSHTGN